ncbi:MAG: polysaccharide biosynthesis tyrosine autokinase [Actinobacteria bacterium]|nr:polysaccharide biosynthesis tyrosine autokinase [Actinomycetota bacterium]
MLPEEPAELELRDYLRILRRRKWLILLVTLLVTAGAVGASLAQTPVYQGKAEVLLQAKATESLFDPNTGARNDPARAIQTEIQVLRSRPVRDRVREKIGKAPKVTASAVGQTDVMEVRAESTDPERAALVANTYVTSYIEFRRNQAVDDLLAAADQIRQKIAQLQAQIDGAVPVATSAAPQVRGARATTTTTDSSDLERQKASLQDQQDLFRQKLDQLQVDAALKSGGAQLVTPAVAPTTPIRPTPRRNAVVALAVGLMLGVGLAFLREYLDDSLKGKEDIERAASGVPVLGFIPELKTWKDPKAAFLVSLTDPHSHATEAYRSLRTSVQFLGLDRSIKIVQMTSPSQAEGKSTTIANLAVGLANAGQRVVLVDADLRRPRIHQFFGLGNDVGFTSILLGDATLSAAIQHVPQVSRLYLLASGPIPPNPSEMLASKRTGELLRALAEHADVVLIDCPPVLPVTDATVLGHRVDATLLVVNAAKTKQAQLRRAVELLGQVEAPLAGVVVNGVADSAAYGYSYGYGGGYRYAYTPREQAGGRRRGSAAGMERDWSVKDGAAAAAPVEWSERPRTAPPEPVVQRPAAPVASEPAVAERAVVRSAEAVHPAGDGRPEVVPGSPGGNGAHPEEAPPAPVVTSPPPPAPPAVAPPPPNGHSVPARPPAPERVPEESGVWRLWRRPTR